MRASLLTRRSEATGQGPRRSESGATAVEYALMIIMVAFVILTAAAALGGKVIEMFQLAAVQF